MKPLMMMNARGLGIGFRKHARVKGLSHTAGPFRNIGRTGVGPKVAATPTGGTNGE